MSFSLGDRGWMNFEHENWKLCDLLSPCLAEVRDRTPLNGSLLELKRIFEAVNALWAVGLGPSASPELREFCNCRIALKEAIDNCAKAIDESDSAKLRQCVQRYFRTKSIVESKYRFND